MSGLADIEQLLHPTVMDSLRDGMAPVQCRVWTGNDEFDEFEITTLFPFDTLDTLKRTISLEYKDDTRFLPPFLFVGLEYEGNVFLPLEYIWYPQGVQKASRMIYLPDPRTVSPLKEFFVRGGGIPTPAANPRGRTTIEDVFGSEGVPTLQVYPLHRLLRAYKGTLGDAEWYQRFYPYFPAVPAAGPYAPSKEDERFGRTIIAYLLKRNSYMAKINALIEGNVPLPELKVTGVKQLRLVLQETEDAFEDCETLFYKTKVTDSRPYMRILPAEGMPVSKVLVKGILPIPALDNPDIIQQWAKEISPTMGKDYLIIKYVHRPSIGTICPIYGSVRIFSDGTADLLLQPPKNIKKLNPASDFRHFSTTLDSVFDTLPFDKDAFEIGEAALIFQLETEAKAPKFTKPVLKKRLPFFSTFFQEIAPLKDQPSLLSLRYKAVSQFASEDNLFAFLTQYATAKKLEGDTITPEMLTTLQEEFQLSALDGRRVIENWLSQGSTLTVTVPEENEFMESFNPGIDIHIYPQHPFYTFHVHRIDSYKTFQRIYTLLALLFSEEEDRFTTTEKGAAALATLSAKVEETTLANEKGLKGVAEEEEAEAEVEEKGTRLRSFLREEDEEPVVKSKSKVKEKVDSESRINPTGWLIKKLQSIDNTIFAYTPTIKDKQYSRVCQAHDDKHPAALTPDQYKHMVAEYKPEIDRGELFFNLYPLERGQKEPAAGVGSILADAKEIVVSRYGSDPANENYYFCPELFCLRDEIMVLESDFDAEVDRDGNEKDKHTCPFCGGKEVNSSKAVSGATVIRREGKSGDDAPLFIGFTKTTFHPDKYALPCCHIKKKTLRIMQPDFERVRTIVKGREETITLPVEEVSASKAAASEELAERSRADVIRADVVEATAYKTTVNYALKFENLYKEYIVDPVKHPLEPGKFAMLPPAFDAYFAQKSDSFIKRAGIRQELKSIGAGFLRMGTQIGLLSASCGANPKPTESLLGVLAPLLFKNSIEDVRELILKSVTGPNGVEIFVNANFGNLVNEFYVPSDPDLGVLRDDRNLSDLAPETKGTNVHIKWAKANLHLTVTDDNQYAINRIFKSYNRFLAFMKDTEKRKDLRHFTSFLVEPGLLTSNIKRGLQIIVLEWTPGSEGDVQIKCSPYGFSADHRNNDFAFVWRDNQGFYELILYTRNEPASGGDLAKHDYRLRWKASERKTWPRIVQDRVQEFMTQCKSNYRSLYTPQSGIDSMALIPLSVALQTPIRMGSTNVYPSAILRDSYNHAVLVLYPMSTDPVHEDTPLVPMPIVDDGKLPLGERLVLDVNDFEKAPVEQLLEFYATHILATFPLYPGYAVKYISTKTSSSGKERVAGVQLRNGILVPSARETKGADLGAYERKPAKVMEWDINRELSKPCGIPEIKDSSTKKLEELYQYFRFMVSNWLAKDAGPTVRKEIERIVFSRLPEFEKRKRLEILCGNFVRGEEGGDGWLQWMAPDEEAWDMPGGFLRKDCRVLDKGGCSAPCVWNDKEGKCRLHVDAETEIGTDRTVNTRILFSRRLIDELIRFPNRRRELMQQSVSHMSTLADPVRDGDQYIIPERGTSWLNLLRLDWMAKDKETPLFYEEMAQQEEKEEEGLALPPALVALVGTTPYQLWKGDLTKTLGSEFGAKNDPFPPEEAFESFVKTMGKPIGFINLLDSSVKFYRPKGVQEKATVVVFDADGLSLLVEDPSQPYISVSTMGRSMKEAWTAAAIKAPKLLRRAISFAPNTKPAAKPSVSQAPPLSAKPLPKVVPKSKKLVRRISAIPEEDEPTTPIESKKSVDVESPLRVLQTPVASKVASVAPAASATTAESAADSNVSSVESDDVAAAFASIAPDAASEASDESDAESDAESEAESEAAEAAESAASEEPLKASVAAPPSAVSEVSNPLTANMITAPVENVPELFASSSSFTSKPAVARTPVVEPAVARTPVIEPVIARTPVIEPAVTRTPVVEPAVTKTPVIEPVVARTPVVEPAVTRTPVIEPVVARTPVVEPVVARTPVIEPVIARTEPVVARTEPPITSVKPSILEKVKPLNPSAVAAKKSRAAKLISLND